MEWKKFQKSLRCKNKRCTRGKQLYRYYIYFILVFFYFLLPLKLSLGILHSIFILMHTRIFYKVALISIAGLFRVVSGIDARHRFFGRAYFGWWFLSPFFFFFFISRGKILSQARAHEEHWSAVLMRAILLFDPSQPNRSCRQRTF